MLDFARIKEIKLIEVVSGHYHIPLRYRGEYANGQCPLPTHKEGDKGKSFSINVAGNYWRCFSESCNQKNDGKKGGDVINFVALMENCREKEAAEKLSEWYGLSKTPTKIVNQLSTKEKPPQRMAEGAGSQIENPHQKDYQYPSTSGDSLKYTEKVRVWFDTIWPVREDETPELHRKRLLSAITSELINNFKAGKAGRVL